MAKIELEIDVINGRKYYIVYSNYGIFKYQSKILAQKKKEQLQKQYGMLA